jgi:glucoamylase
MQPWYLCTFAVAEQLYRALQVWEAQAQGITVTSLSLAFFQQFDSSVATGTIAAGSEQYTSITAAIKTFADGFITVGAKYTPSDGALAEQFLRSNGQAASAVDLTWSYASILTALDARAGIAAESWGAGNLTLTGCSA